MGSMNMITIYLFMLLSPFTQNVLIDFEKDSSSEWLIVNDGVMGGVSDSKFYCNEKNIGVFEGHVSLENNGGFASMRHEIQKKIKGFSKVKILLKGDKKNYQFRIKESIEDRHSYKHEFKTSGEWQEISIELKKMSPTWRGMKPNLPNFNANHIEQIGFLIANEKEQDFKLMLKKIWLE